MDGQNFTRSAQGGEGCSERCSVPASECSSGVASRAGRDRPTCGCTNHLLLVELWALEGLSDFGFFFQAWILYLKRLLSEKPSKENRSLPIADVWSYAGRAGGGMRVRGSLVEP